MKVDAEVKKIWKYKGRKCVIIWVHNNHFCAYVETKLKNVAYSQEFGDYHTSPEGNISCHGGLTFAGNISELNDNKWYFGMDFAHYGDYIEGLSNMEEGHQWLLGEVQDEANKMCDSILEYEKVYPRYKKQFKNFQRALELERRRK